MTGTVLVIEDNDQNRYLATYLLDQRGYTVHSAVDGHNGIELAIDLVPDVILLDIQLPGMDGYTVAGRLREVEALRSVPIVAVTSYAMVGDRERCLEAGCTGYIEKPIQPETFVDEVEQFRTRSSRVAPATRSGTEPETDKRTGEDRR